MPGHLPPHVRKRLAQVLGEGLRTARHGAALTQEDMAQRLGLATSTYRRLERGRMAPGVSTLRKLRQVLCVSLDSLLGPDCAAAVERAIRPPRRRRPARASTRRPRSSPREPPHPIFSLPSQVYPFASHDPWNLLAAASRLPVTEVLPLLLLRRGTPLALVVDLG
ncbi:MAG TPA: helix-turn-helix transcriptional regulator [Archangium sp.]|jgi:transcriptional regulator with XRE-family HTH domain|uniref:helix-turn-helix domain-containing protein n=1 Tax=Archangium sp. TaxID=1872627 RepID=UPI002EDBB778